MSTIQLTLRLMEGGSFRAKATVVRLFEGAFAVSIEENPQEILSILTMRLEGPTGDAPHSEDEPKARQESTVVKPVSVWDRIRALPYAEKFILAGKADRSERAALIQDTDPQLLYYLLKNPRITIEEVLRIARLTTISAAVADQIAKTAQWSSNQEIRCALVNNARTSTTLAIKLLPTLPEHEIRRIAKSTASSLALKQAAVKILMSRR